MKFDLLQWLIGINLPLAFLLYASTAMMQKRMTASRIREIATTCVDKISAAFMTGSLAEDTKKHSEQQVLTIIHNAKPSFSCFSDVSLFLLSVSFWTFSAFVSHMIAAIVYKAQNPTVTEGFVYTAAVVFALLYLVNLLVFVIGHGTWSWLFSYLTLKEVDNV